MSLSASVIHALSRLCTEAESDMRVSRAVHVHGSRTRFMFRHVHVYTIYGNGARAFFNPRRRACAARVTVLGSCVCCVCVCPFVCYHVFSDYAQRHNETAIPTGSSLNWLHFKKGDFRITTAFRSYGVKSKRKSQLLMSTHLPRRYSSDI